MSRFGPPLVLLALLLAGCATEEDARPEPTVSAAPSLERSTTSTTVAPIISTTTSTTTIPLTTSAPTTTPSPAEAVVAATCALLRTAPWPERRAAIMVNTAGYEAAGGAGPLIDPVRGACPDEVARAEATTALEDRVRAAEAELAVAGDAGLMEAGGRCGDGVFDVIVKNPSSEPVGVIAGSQTFVDDGVDQPVDHAEVVWSIAPGSDVSLALPDDPAPGCAANAVYFAADPGPVDASLPVAVDPAATGDDPAAWLLSLVTAGRDASADVRVLRDRNEPPVPPINDGHPILSTTVCPSTLNQLDADHVAFAYRTEFGAATVDLGDGPVKHPAFSLLEYDAFRRGADGQWRSLVGGQPLTGTQTAADCGPVVPTRDRRSHTRDLGGILDLGGIPWRPPSGRPPRST